MAQLIAALGVGALLKELVKGVIGWLGGSHARSRARASDILTQRDDAYKRAEKAEAHADQADAIADYEARERRRIAEYASALRRDCMEHGIAQEDLRTWPRPGPPPGTPQHQ